MGVPGPPRPPTGPLGAKPSVPCQGLSKLQELVRYHVYNHGQLTVEKLISKGRILTMANQVLAMNISEEGRILLGPEGVPLQRVDLLASNGVIHMLDGILLPPTILPILPKHCSEEQHKIVVGSCVDCQALNTSTCPLNSVKLDILPKECVYIHDPAGLNVLKKGCASYCNQTIMKQGCCKGFFGPDCTQCPGGFSSPCYGKGNCSDGIQGNGACLCFPDYKGIACHICSNPNKHGDQCQEAALLPSSTYRLRLCPWSLRQPSRQWGGVPAGHVCPWLQWPLLQ
ncbi:stabilin-1-like isoform X2 [Sapajus apella]|uniref:Stabilin-1-like isoform X2 n=1 Tax=Sapajus apella TaxID=9515 RepID=A0A6J3HHQ5_SAPAP|nr:stabilin-1-like isoform X2 [Sapajus apella]